jgi:hypothetical protein
MLASHARRLAWGARFDERDGDAAFGEVHAQSQTHRPAADDQCLNLLVA